MNTVLRAVRVSAACLMILMLSGCGGSSGDTNVPTYTIGGAVSGLTGSVVLQNNGGNNLSISTAGAFTFSTALASGAAYNVTVLTQPPGQTCTVTGGSGTVSLANVTSVAVTCTTNIYTLGGTVSGLGAGKSMVLYAASDAVAGNYTATINGAFTFPVTFDGNAEYIVEVLTQPVGQTCSVINGEGDFANANVTHVAVTCINNSPSSRNWETALNIATDPDVTDSNQLETPRVGVDAAGNALAVWSAGHVGPTENIDDEFGTSAGIEWSRRPVGGETQPEYVWIKHPDLPSGAENLRISIDSGERVLLIWEAAGIIYYNRHTAGGGWVNPVDGTGGVVSGVVGYARDPEMAMNAAGQAVAIWRHRDTSETPGAYELRASRYDMDANAWTTPQTVDPVSMSATFGVLGVKSVVIDSVGVASAVWAQYDGVRMRIMFNRLTGDTWATAAAIETGNDIPQGYALDPHAVIDGSGNIMAVWQQGDVNEGHFVANRYAPGTGWGTQQNIGEYAGSSSPIFSTEMSLAGNAAGHVVAVWTLPGGVGDENVPFPTDVNANEYNPDNGDWGAEEVIDKENLYAGEHEGEASSPHVAVDPAGNAVAVWDQDGGLDTDGIRSSRYQ